MYPVFRCDVSKFHDLKELEFPTRYFVLFLAADYNSIDQEEMIAIASELIAKGNAYLCAWGEDCGIGDTNWDIAAVETESEKKYGFFTMTTWHEDETIEGGVWFALNCAPVDQHIWNETSIILASVGNETWKNQIQAICDDPVGFSQRVLEEEEKLSQPGSSHNVGKRSPLS
ncbi:hypothetical protein ACFFKJ_22355 [Pelagicoccus mobilis]